MAFGRLVGTRSLRSVWGGVSQPSRLAQNPSAAGLGRASVTQRLSAGVCREQVDGSAPAGIHRRAEGTVGTTPRLRLGDSVPNAGTRSALAVPRGQSRNALRLVQSDFRLV